MIKVVKLNKEQWEKILPYIIISNYGDKFSYFESIEKILTANKVVTLNGHSMWKKRSTTSSIAERIERYHMIFELPNGNFAVSSQKFNDYYITKKEIIIINEEQITWYSHSSNSSDITL